MFWSPQKRVAHTLDRKPQWCDDLKYSATARKTTKKGGEGLITFRIFDSCHHSGASIVKDHNAAIYMSKESRHTMPR